ncbi:DUF5959 family protein [Streptomyces sp. NPDC050698]
MDLIHLSDGDNRFRVRVLGRCMPGVLPLYDLLDAEVLIGSGFGNSRLGLSLFPKGLASWSKALDTLASGGDVCWTDDDRSPEIQIQALNEEHGTAVVRVEDATGSGASVFLPLCIDEGWPNDQRKLLEQVRLEWPSEVPMSGALRLFLQRFDDDLRDVRAGDLPRSTGRGSSHRLWLTPPTGIDPAAYGGVWSEVVNQLDRTLRAFPPDDRHLCAPACPWHQRGHDGILTEISCGFTLCDSFVRERHERSPSEDGRPDSGR